MNTNRDTHSKKHEYGILFLKGSVISIVAVVLIGIINLFTRRSLALYLSPTDYGFIYSIFSFLSIFITIFDTGFGQSSVILIVEDNRDKHLDKANHIFASLFTLRLVIAIILVLTTLITGHFLATFYFKHPAGSTAVRIMGIWMGTMVVASSLSSFLEGQKHFGIRQALYLSYYGSVFLFVLICREHMTSTLAATAMAVGGLLACILFCTYIRKCYALQFFATAKSLKKHFSRIIHLSKWVSISAAGLMIMFSIDTVMLTHYQGLDSVALYNIALPIMQIFLSIMLILPLVFTPIATELWNLGKIKRLCRFVILITAVVFTIMASGLIVLYFAKNWIITMIFSDAYIGAGTALLFLVASIPFYLAAQIHITVLNSMGRQKHGALIVFSSVIINVTLNAFLIPRADIAGAASATFLSYLYLFSASAATFWKVLPASRQ